jgi:CheY-like chemotaxis protein
LKADAAPAELSERHILLIDGGRSVLSILKRMLEYSGYSVSAFPNPCVVIEALRKNPAAFHFVITDYNMLVMPGLEVAAAVRQLSPKVPIAVSSGFLDDQLRTSAAQVGVAELISKPFTATELSAMLDRVFRSLRHSA